MRERVLEHLENSQCCPRCILRFLGDSKQTFDGQDFYKKFQEVSIQQPLEQNLPKKPRLDSAGPCIVCLGVLSTLCAPDCLEMISQSVMKEGFEFEDFIIQLSLPPSIAVREKLFTLSLKNKFPEVFQDDWSPPSIKEVWKWVAGPHLARSLLSDFKPSSSFFIGVEICHSSMGDDCHPLKNSCPEVFIRNKSRELYPRPAIQKCLDTLPPQKLLELYKEPMKMSSAQCNYGQIACTHAPIYIGGRYNKYSRDLCQTPWYIDGKRARDTSVEELMTEVLKLHLKYDKAVFSSSGREDVDVRMLGKGRPFVLELVNPRSTHPDLTPIEEAINSGTEDIAVHQLRVVSKEQVELLKVGEEQKRKSYSALCVLSRPIQPSDLEALEKVEDLALEQSTPIRVLHRRPLAMRIRTIHSIQPEVVSENQLRLKLVTQAGTYIKEFVHGDFGRTRPNLAAILGISGADIQELDVTVSFVSLVARDVASTLLCAQEIDLQWPPS